MKIVALVEAKTGEVRATALDRLDYIRIRKTLVKNVDRKSTLITDDANL